MPEFQGHDGNIYFEVTGQGEPLVLIRGLGRSIRHWHGYDQSLADGYKVITLDLRGIGRTTKPARYSDTIFSLARDVLDIIDFVGETSAHVMGVSLGGMISLATGLTDPTKVRSITVINTSVAGLRAPRLTPLAVKTIFSGATYRRRQIHTMLSDALTGPDATDEMKAELAEKYKRIAGLEGMNERTVMRQLVAAARFTVKKQLKEMQVPTLVLYGTNDKFVPGVNSKRLFKLLPNSKLIAIEGGGHELTLDRPQEVRRALDEWTQLHGRSGK